MAVVSIERLLELKLIKPENFSTGKPFETIRTYFCLRNHWQFGWSYPPQPHAEQTLLSPSWQQSMFEGDWAEYQGAAGYAPHHYPNSKAIAHY